MFRFNFPYGNAKSFGNHIDKGFSHGSRFDNHARGFGETTGGHHFPQVEVAKTAYHFEIDAFAGLSTLKAFLTGSFVSKLLSVSFDCLSINMPVGSPDDDSSSPDEPDFTQGHVKSFETHIEKDHIKSLYNDKHTDRYIEAMEAGYVPSDEMVETIMNLESDTFPALPTLQDYLAGNFGPKFVTELPSEVSIDEDSTTAVATVEVSDPQGDDLTYEIFGADADHFVFDQETGELSFASAPDFENPQDAGADNVYDVGVRVSDGVFEAESTMSVRVDDVSELPESYGVLLQANDVTVRSSLAVSAAGDVNGDGIDDILVGDKFASSNGISSGATYVVFGSEDGLPSIVNLTNLDGSNGFVLNGIDGNDQSGFAISAAGDVNGDGVDDILIGAPSAGPNGNARSGEAYVVFGSADGFDGSIDLSSLNGSNGFVLNGVDTNDKAGSAVTAAGDVNGDGIDDIVISATGATVNGERSAGESYVVFGSADGFDANFDLGALDGSNGFKLEGSGRYTSTGFSVSAGDVNGDGINDILIGAPSAGPTDDRYAGETYVAFGSSDGFADTISLDSLDGSNGFVINGANGSDRAGWSVASAGDVNNDGVEDFAIGAATASPGDISNAGATHIVFGSAELSGASFDLEALDGSNGFTIVGLNEYGQFGSSVSSAGDINGDGIDDILIGAPGGEPGESYVVFGSEEAFDDFFDLSTLDGSNGFVLKGQIDEYKLASSVSSAGDVNGDGFDDILVGGAQSGYIVFGGEEVLSRYDAADGSVDGSLDLGLITQMPMESDFIFA